ncbi:MAG: 30S ribosomal protein S13 [Candidatus Micrarchaeia archaeon]
MENTNSSATTKNATEVAEIVRIKGKDIKGKLPIYRALPLIKGIGTNLSFAICYVLNKMFGIEREAPIGSLNEEQIKKLEEIINNPTSFGIPPFLVNRRKDPETGKDLHLTSEDLSLRVKMDIEREKQLNTWRGFRHMYGQKVRGQRTRTTGRTGMTVGVMKKSVMEKLKGKEGKEEKKEKK